MERKFKLENIYRLPKNVILNMSMKCEELRKVPMQPSTM